MIAYLNGFEINTDASRFYLNEDVTGLELPSIRTSSGVFSGQDGGYVAAQYYGMRSISLVGQAFGEDVSDIEARRRDLQSAVSSKNVTLVVVTTAGNTYSVECNLTAFEMPIKRTVNIAPFKIELLAPDPLIYDYTNGSSLTANLLKAVGGGYTYPVVYPVIWADGTQPTDVINSGTAAVYPTITITGTATNPKITNITTGRSFQINGLTMGPSDTLVIDMKNKTVLFNGSSVYYLITAASKWLYLIPNDNLMKYETDSSGDTAVAVITWRNGYWGL